MSRFIRSLWFCVVPLVQASILDDTAPVTLDPGAMSRAWQAASSGAHPEQTAATGGAWQAAMLQQNPELQRVQLLVWLVEQNPLLPLAAHPQDYAAAVALHIGALAGQPAACASLAEAYRAGRLGLLSLPHCEQKARWFEQRALIAEKLPQ